MNSRTGATRFVRQRPEVPHPCTRLPLLVRLRWRCEAMGKRRAGFFVRDGQIDAGQALSALCAGYGVGQGVLDTRQNTAGAGAFGQFLDLDATPAWALDKVAGFKIKPAFVGKGLDWEFGPIHFARLISQRHQVLIHRRERHSIRTEPTLLT